MEGEEYPISSYRRGNHGEAATSMFSCQQANPSAYFLLSLWEVEVREKHSLLQYENDVDDKFNQHTKQSHDI